MRATRAIIHLDNFRENLALIRRRIGNGVKMCVAIKADAYGHGALEIARAADQEGVEFLGVATTDEGCELSSSGIRASILLLSVPLAEEIPLLVGGGLIPIIPDERLIEEIASEASKQGKKVTVHLKIDTGMGRLGIKPSDAVRIAQHINRNAWMTLGGVCTHLSASDMKDEAQDNKQATTEKVTARMGGRQRGGSVAESDRSAERIDSIPNSSHPGDKTSGAIFTRSQLALFSETLRNLRNAGINTGIVHAANSGAVIAWPQLYFDMVRPGILAYGYYPSKDQERALPVKPVMELQTKIVFMKKVAKGTPISYGVSYKAKEDTVIATLPVGYGDGYSRLLSNRADVVINNKRYPVAGRVCMDHTMVDLGPNPEVTIFSDVTLFGPGEAGVNAEEIASLMGTIPYEVTCLITKRVPRVFVG